MIQFILNKANESSNADLRASTRRNFSARRLPKTENPVYRTSTRRYSELSAAEQPVYKTSTRKRLSELSEAEQPVYSTSTRKRLSVTELSTTEHPAYNTSGRRRLSGFGRASQRNISWRNAIPPQEGDDDSALEDPFFDFPPYDSIWKKTFLVYKRLGERFCLEEWPSIFRGLTALREDGLRVQRHFQDPSTCEPTNSNLSGPMHEAFIEEKIENTTVLGLKHETLQMQQLLLKNQINVSEADISECLKEASSANSACSKLHSIDKDADFNMEPFGDFSAVLKEASAIVGGRLDADDLVVVLETLIAQSRPLTNSVCTVGSSITGHFTQHIVTAMETLVKKRLKQLEILTFKDSDAEDCALLNLIEKVIYLCLRNGYHFNQGSKHLLHSFAKKVWSEIKNARFEELFSKHYPFLMFKLIVWDNLDKYTSNQFFTMGILSKLFRPFKISLRAVILLSKTPIFECLEVIAMIACRKEKRRGRFEHDDIDFIHRLCLKMLNEGMQSEAMDDNSFAFLMMEYQCASTLEQSPLKTGPINLALKHEVGEFLCLHRPQEILELVWCGDLYNLLSRRTKPLLYSSLGQVWNSNHLFLNTIHHTHYKTCPCFVGLLDFLAWATFLGCTYCTLFLATNSEKQGYTEELSIYHYILFSITATFAFNELRLVMQNGIWDHFESLWNVQDAVIILTVVLFAICKESVHMRNFFAFEALTIVSILILFRTLYFATIFRSYGMLVSALFIMMGDVIKFILLFLVILVGFAVVMVAFFPDSEQFQSFSVALTYLFSSGLASFDYGWFDGTANPTGGVIILTIYVIIANVILLNMLIAILADTYANMTEIRNQSSAVARAKFIQEYEDLPIPLNSISFICTLVSSVLKGKMKLWWDYACLKFYYMVEFVMTLLAIGPFMCIMDCWYIGYIFTFSVSTKYKKYYADEFQAAGQTTYHNKDATFSQVVKLLRNAAEIVCSTLFFISMLFVFVVLYFGRLAYNMMVRTYLIPSDQSTCADSECSFQECEPSRESEHYLRSLQEAMVQVFHFDDDDTEDLLLELDDKVNNVMSSVEELNSQNSTTLQEFKEKQTNELSKEIQCLTEKMDRMEKLVTQRISGIDQVNSKILTLLLETNDIKEQNKNNATWNIFDCPIAKTN